MLFDIFFKSKTIQKLPVITDIHCHVVPGVDDGASTLEKSISLLRHMHDWGIERVFASPHSTQDKFENTPQTIAEPFALLKDAVESERLPVELHRHMEYRLDNFFLEHFEADDLLHMPQNFLMIENSFANEPWSMEQLLHRIRCKGFVPVLAHPERYKYYSDGHLNRYTELHEFGVYFQINLLSLAGYYGKAERETALYLLKNGLVQFLGTDLHHSLHVESIENYLRSRQYQRDLKLLDRLQNDTI